MDVAETCHLCGRPAEFPIKAKRECGDRDKPKQPTANKRSQIKSNLDTGRLRMSPHKQSGRADHVSDCCKDEGDDTNQCGFDIA
ncbi:MAG TPA: hypothetical protein VGK48_05045, partial [Terriglobia bacterium]